MAKIHLHKSSTDKFISGVCGGIGESTGVDSTIIRLVWALLTVVTGVAGGIILYIIAALIMPDD